MSKVECKCKSCGEEFLRVVLRGSDPPAIACPKCLSRECEVSKSEHGLFNGIANFSTLARDFN